MNVQTKTATSVTLVLVLLCAGYAALRGDDAGSSRSNAAFAQNGSPGAGARRLVVAGLGVVEPEAGTADLAALMGGVLSSVRVKEGDRVRKGDILAEIINDDLKARVAQFEATLAIKTAQMNQIEAGPRAEEIMRAEAQLREEESNGKLLQLQVDRRQSLAREGAVSTEALNTVVSGLAASKERRSAAAQNLAILRQGSRPEEIKAARAEVKLAQNQLAEAQASLAKSYVRAISDGVVLRRYREPGEAISTQNVVPVLQMADISRLVVRTQIDETDIAELRVGQTARISAAALGGRTLTGKVSRISPRLGAKTVVSDAPTEKRDTRVLDVMVALPADTALPINLRVDVVIELGAAEARAAQGPAAGVPVSELRGALGREDAAMMPGARLAAAQPLDRCIGPRRETMEEDPCTSASPTVDAADLHAAPPRMRQSLLTSD